MQPNLLMAIILPVFVACLQPVPSPVPESTAIAKTEDNPYHSINQVPVPDGFKRIPVASSSFGEWLRTQPLKKGKTVFLFNGSPKYNQQAQFAVLDISTGKKDLQQCADAVMRLRAEYLYQQHRYSEIVFKDNSGKRYECPPNANREQFNKYLELVFSWCGTISLEKQLLPVKEVNEVQPGDVFIKGGSPGHAAIVMDVVQNAKGERMIMVANGYMPAQDIHVVRNIYNEEASPWIEVKNKVPVQLPEWVFSSNQLRRW
jgi:Domain of unknown function (4846)